MATVIEPVTAAHGPPVFCALCFSVIFVTDLSAVFFFSDPKREL